MSYILDALKRADAERERAAVPGLHAHPQDGLSTTAGRGRSLPWPALAVGAVVVLGGALAWVLLSDRGVRTPPLVAGAPPSAEAPAPLPTAAPPVVAEPAATPTVVMPPPAPPPAPAPRAPTPAAPAAAAAPGAVTTPPVRVPTLAELPAEVRASLPPLAISGAVYSPTPSARLLFIGGQVLREGDAVAEGVVIERIGASASVLSARGQRFEIRH